MNPSLVCHKSRSMTRSPLLDSPSSYRSLVLRSPNQRNIFLLFSYSFITTSPISLIPILRRHCSYVYRTRTAPRLSVCMSANLHVSSVLYKLNEKLANPAYDQLLPLHRDTPGNFVLCRWVVWQGKRKGGVTPPLPHPPQLSILLPFPPDSDT